jgi:hypothetical protein
VVEEECEGGVRTVTMLLLGLIKRKQAHTCNVSILII